MHRRTRPASRKTFRGLRVESLESRQLMSGDLGVASGYAVPELVARPTAAPAAAVASFVGTDATTGGNWTSAYGADGYQIVGGQTALPSYATLTPSGAATYAWAPTTSDGRALLQGPSSAASQ